MEKNATTSSYIHELPPKFNLLSVNLIFQKEVSNAYIKVIKTIHENTSIRKETSCMIICPRCYSKNIYRYGKEPLTKLQKYQCKDCKKQFIPGKSLKERSSVYPKCPKCNKGTYLHHDYKYYSHFTCNDKKCNHSIYIPKDTAIKTISYELLNSSDKVFLRNRTPLNLIINALYFYFVNFSSTRAVSNLLFDRFNIKISHVSIHNWINKFAPFFKNIASKYLPKTLHYSDYWHVDETVININAKKYYIWTIVDSETRFVMNYHLSQFRDSAQAFALLHDTKSKFGEPKFIVSDRLSSYNIPVKTIFNNSTHIKVEKFNSDINNNIIESLFSNFKSRYHCFRGLKSFDKANALIATFFFFYNFIKPHSSLNNLTPARVAGVNYSELKRKNLLIL